jgi:hypothetical protein
VVGVDAQLKTTGPAPQGGFAIVSVLSVLVPLMAVVGAMIALLGGRSARLQAAIGKSRASTAAEAGVDAALFLANDGSLISGSPVSFDLGGGLGYVIDPLWLGGDSDDNDSDGSTDEVDEQAWQIVVRGTHGRSEARVVAHFRKATGLPVVPAVVRVHAPATALTLTGTTLISGADVNIDGTPGSPTDDVYGIAIAAPGTAADLAAQLDPGESSVVEGVGGAPSLTVSPGVDVQALIDRYRTFHDVDLVASTYSGASFGDGPGGLFQITFRNGDLELTAGSTAAGILVVDGDLDLNAGSRVDGIVIVRGAVRLGGSAIVRGSLLVGPACSEVSDTGGSQVCYSVEAVDRARLLDERFRISAWQEVVLD